LAIRDGTIATVMGTGELIFTLKGSPSRSAAMPSKIFAS